MDSSINVTDYGIFSDAVNSTKVYCDSINHVNEVMKNSKAILCDENIFMGPGQQSCINTFNKMDGGFSETTANLSKISSYLTETAVAYNNGDMNAGNAILGTSGATSPSGSTASFPGSPVSSVEIPDDVQQGKYSVTCYGKEGWFLSGGDTPTESSSNAPQYKVHEAWLADGARYKNGIAVMNVDGQDCYLVATAPTFGKVGDKILTYFQNGQRIPCIIADAKSTHDSTYTTYGHVHKDGSVNILEFEVDKEVWKAKGNPQTSTWGLDWDSSSKILHIDNYGAIS
jgi:hypothetical protein